MIEFMRDKGLFPPLPKSSAVPEPQAKKAYAFQANGDKLFIANRFKLAQEAYGKSLEIYSSVGESLSIASLRLRRGRTLELTGEYAKAGEDYREGLRVFESASDLPGIARAKAHLGNLSWALGEYEPSEKFLEESLALYKVGEDIAGEAWVLDLLGNLHLAKRDEDRAEGYHRGAFELIDSLGVNLENQAWNDYHLGALALARGKAADAKGYFSGALKKFTKLKDDLGQVASLTHLGEIACGQKDLSGARKNLQQAVKLVLPTGCKPLLADVLTAVARLMKCLGEDRKSVSLLMVALSHPTCRQQTKDRMVDLAMALNAHFSEAEAHQGFEWAKSMSLEELAWGWAFPSPSRGNGKNRKTDPL